MAKVSIREIFDSMGFHSISVTVMKAPVATVKGWARVNVSHPMRFVEDPRVKIELGKYCAMPTGVPMQYITVSVAVADSRRLAELPSCLAIASVRSGNSIELLAEAVFQTLAPATPAEVMKHAPLTGMLDVLSEYEVTLTSIGAPAILNAASATISSTESPVATSALSVCASTTPLGL